VYRSRTGKTDRKGKKKKRSREGKREEWVKIRCLNCRKSQQALGRVDRGLGK